jgi:hypothetical protein
MTQSEQQDELARLRRRATLIQVLEAPGPILIGLAIHGKHAMGAAFHPLLNNPDVTTGMIVVGGVIVVVGMSFLFPLWRRIYVLDRDLKVVRNA